jgi:hypothetical protein
MTTLRITATYEYELPDDPAERKLAYGVLSVAKCIAVDLENASDIMLGHISQAEEGDEVTFTIEELG